MGVNEINDGRDSLLTERMENIRRVQRREGHAGGGGREFQQMFEFAEGEHREEGDNREHGDSREHGDNRERERAAPPLPVAPPRAVTKEDVEKAKSRDQLTLGQFIDVEA